MEVTLKIPDDIAKEIRNGGETPLDRRVLELAAIQAHLSNLINEREVMEVLGFQDREECTNFSSGMMYAANTRVRTLKQVVPRLRTC